MVSFARASEETSRKVSFVALVVEMKGRPLAEPLRATLLRFPLAPPTLPCLAPPRSAPTRLAPPGPPRPRRALPRPAPPAGCPGFGVD